jgi:hypothetical protein
MGMQTDVLASGVRTADGLLVDQAGNSLQAVRIKSILIVPASGAGSVTFKDGGAGGTAKFTINTLAASTNNDYLLLPGEGVLFRQNVYVDITDVASVMVFYG